MNPEEAPVLPTEQPDEAAQAQAAREAAALRGARGQLRRTPVAMTEMAPAKIASDEEYAALAPGSYFIAPDGQKLRKPWYVTDDASYDTVPEGEIFVAPDGRKMQKPKYEGLPYTVQTLYNMAVNDKERMKILEQAYPGRVRTTPRGELYVEEEGGVRRKGKGFTESPGAYISAEAAPALGATAAEIGGAALGFLGGGPPGAVAGGVVGGGAGGAAGQGFNDIVLSLAGAYDRSGEEAGWQYTKQGLLGAAGSALGRVVLPMGKSLYQWGKDVAPSALGKFLGADKTALDTAVGLADQGVKVPPSTWAKEAPHIQNLVEVLDPAFRTQRVLEQSSTEHMERQSGNILRSLGIEEPMSVTKPTAAVPVEAAGAAVKARALEDLATSDAQLADKIAQRRAEVMTEDVLQGMNRRPKEELERLAEQNRQAAQQLINQGFQDIQRSVDDAMRAANADANSGGLWQQVAERLRALRQAVVTRHQRWYDQAYEVAGDVPLNVTGLANTAGDFLSQLPDGFAAQYPRIVQSLRDLAGRRDPTNGAWIVEPVEPTFAQLHQLRSQLRNNVNWYALPSDITNGTYKFFSRQVDDVLHDATAPANLRTAAQMLDATDRSYGANMAAFNDARLNSVVKGIESGLPADPKTLFDTLVREGRSDLTNWVRDRVGPNLWAGVRAADVQDMLINSRNLDGTIDGARFVAEVLKRHRQDMLEAVHGPEARRLIQQAQHIQALNGTIDIPVRPGDTLSEVIARARQAADAAQAAAARSPMDTLEQEIKRITREHRAEMGQRMASDPLGFLMKPSVGVTDAVNRILAKEDTILAAAARFGEQSPEFNMLRQIWAQRILRQSTNPGKALENVSPAIQQLMFPGVTLEQMHLLAREMEFLLGAKSAKGGAGRSIMATETVEHPKGKLIGGIGKYLPNVPLVDAGARYVLGKYFQIVTDLTTSPAFLKFIQRGLQGNEADKVTARNMLRAMLYGKGANRGGALGAGTLSGTGATPTGNGREGVDPAQLGAQQAPNGFWQMQE